MLSPFCTPSLRTHFSAGVLNRMGSKVQSVSVFRSSYPTVQTKPSCTEQVFIWHIQNARFYWKSTRYARRNPSALAPHWLHLDLIGFQCGVNGLLQRLEELGHHCALTGLGRLLHEAVNYACMWGQQILWTLEGRVGPWHQ